MNQNEFFNILMDGFKDFPETILQDIISYYENSFTLGLDAGKTEEEILNELGNPTLIVIKYRDEYLKTPINSEYITTDTDITSISDNNFINDVDCTNYSNFIINDATFIKEQNLITDNNEGNYKSTNLNNSNCNSNSLSYNSKNSNYNSANISDSNLNNIKNNSKNKILQFNINTILKICIVILALIIFSPVITGIIGCIIGLFGVAISILLASIGVLVGGTFTSFIGVSNLPMFVTNFPYPVIVLFSLGSILLSIFLIILFYYLCKLFIQLSIKAYNFLKSERGAY